MYRIFFSNSLKALADHLGSLLDEHLPDDIFSSQTIIVPNLDTAGWLKLFIAEKNGIAANYQFLLPAEWQWKQVRKIYPDLPTALGSDSGPMKWAIFEILMNPEERHVFPVLERYILAHGEGREESAALQVSTQIAFVFDQYINYRPDMLLRWQNGKSGNDTDEAWQSELWRRLCRRWKKPANGSIQRNKAELLVKTINAMGNGRIEVEDHLYFFNTGLIPKPVLSLLNAAGKYCTADLFLVEPTRDLLMPENELLESFGHDATQIKRLFHVPGVSEEYLCNDHFPGTLLGSIKQSITQNIPLKNIATNANPETVQVRACHSPLREVETLHQFLLGLFENDDTLLPDDILVASPNLEDYAPFIHAVFDNPEAGHPELPYHLATFRHNNELERALSQLLTIADSRFYFAPVLDFFNMDPVRETFGLSETEAGLVKQWMKENQVIWGLNAAHRAEHGQPADDLQTWQLALKRGWLGQLMGETSHFEKGVPLLYHGVQNISQQETWAAFSFFLHLLEELRQQVQTPRSIAGWCNWLHSIFPHFFSDRIRNGPEWIRIMQMIEKLSEYANLAGNISTVPFTLFRNEIVKMLEGSRAAGARFTAGITFSSMVPVRSIPFRVIALIGLNDQSFPRIASAPDFDLMARLPLEGERNRKQEDRNLFLESILAAGDVHYCSYIGQSPVDNETIPPSSVVNEWLDAISKASGLEESQILKKEALTGFSPSDFRNGGSYSGNYFSALEMMRNDENTVNGLEQNQPLPEQDDQEKVSVSDLIRFFKNPPAGFLQKRFGVYFDEPDDEKEEFEQSHLEAHILFQNVIGWLMSGKNEGEIRTLLSGTGILPSGWPGEKLMNSHLENAQTAILTLREQDIVPEYHHFEIDISLNDNEISGFISTYSKDFLLDINPSKLSGRNLIQCWIAHLCHIENGGKDSTILLCDLKKGDPKLIRFFDPGNTTDLLSGLIQLYKEGLVSPLHFFPDTLVQFCDNVESRREHQARLAFEGGFNSYGERENLFVKTLLGSGVLFSNAFLDERFIAVIDAMLASKEEVVC